MIGQIHACSAEETETRLNINEQSDARSSTRPASVNVDGGCRFGPCSLRDRCFITLSLLTIRACDAYQKLIFRERHRAHAFRAKNRIDLRSPTAKHGSGCLVFQGADLGDA
jgi:hypothetical protein